MAKHAAHGVPVLGGQTNSESDQQAKDVGGNASQDTKAYITRMLSTLSTSRKSFAVDIGGRLVVTDISILKKSEEPSKLEGRVVCEITVDEDMINFGGNLHGGCSAYLVDVCTSLPIAALSSASGGQSWGGVSQALDVVFHSPASVGDRLRIVSTTMTLGSRSMTARCEIWNASKHRLVASGVHIKMEPSQPKL